MKIKVTKKDIKMGIPGSSACCPVAQAPMRKGYWDIRVGVDKIILIDGMQYNVPEWVCKKIAKYDVEKKMSPFEFEARRRK